MSFLRVPIFCFAGLVLATASVQAQTAVPAAPAQPQGDVLFQSQGDATVTARVITEADKVPEVSDAERAAILVTGYDLDARISPASSHLGMRARLTLRNDGAVPLLRIALQISSTLVWESVSLAGEQGGKLPLVQHEVDTDADHTGRVSEMVLTLPQPLAAGASVALDTFYSGTVGADATRLVRIGADAKQALSNDWDAISDGATQLRGFGNVLWYPVSAPALFLGDGAKLFQAIDEMRLREEVASVQLRLAVEYKGEPPVAAYFCGRRQALAALPDDPNAPVVSGSGMATASFPAGRLGFRLPSLFLVEVVETQPDPMLAVATNDDGSVPRLKSLAESIAPVLEQWFGERPLTALTVLDQQHPADGQPFEDGPLLVAPLANMAASSASGALAHSMTHAWVQTGQPWFDEGLAQFATLLWTERQQGRAVAVAQLNELTRPLALAEPAFDEATPTTELGQPLIHASGEIYYRRKAAAVWWMLRGMVGDAALQQALSAWRLQAVLQESAEAQAEAFERLLEKTSGKDLGWFFNDWVLHDRGLPDLSITGVEPRQLPAGQGHDSGWLVAVSVRNEGAAAVEVPLVIRSGTYSVTKRLHIGGLSSMTDRVLLEAPPTEVLLNDGSTPEVRTSSHSRMVVAKTE